MVALALFGGEYSKKNPTEWKYKKKIQQKFVEESIPCAVCKHRPRSSHSPALVCVVLLRTNVPKNQSNGTCASIPRDPVGYNTLPCNSKPNHITDSCAGAGTKHYIWNMACTENGSPIPIYPYVFIVVVCRSPCCSNNRIVPIPGHHETHYSCCFLLFHFRCFAPSTFYVIVYTFVDNIYTCSSHRPNGTFVAIRDKNSIFMLNVHNLLILFFLSLAYFCCCVFVVIRTFYWECAVCEIVILAQ